MVSTVDEQQRFMRRDLPPEVLAVSPVSVAPRHGARGLSLPLNIIATIISYVCPFNTYHNVWRWD